MSYVVLRDTIHAMRDVLIYKHIILWYLHLRSNTPVVLVMFVSSVGSPEVSRFTCAAGSGYIVLYIGPCMKHRR